MKVYVPFKNVEDDLLLLKWWQYMAEHGELEKTFGANADTISGFYAVFSRGTQLVIEDDDQGITVAVWVDILGFNPMMMLGMWVRGDKRHAPSTLKTVLQIYDHLFQYEGVEVIVGITRQPEILQEHERLGYNVVCKLPRVWLGKDAWQVMLQKEDFYKAAKHMMDRRAA